MWPLISSSRMSAAWPTASSGVSANFTRPAFIRPPVRSCDLITVGPPMRSAIARASSASVTNPKSVTGMPARLTISRASYSKNLMEAREPTNARNRPGNSPVFGASRVDGWSLSRRRQQADTACMPRLGAFLLGAIASLLLAQAAHASYPGVNGFIISGTQIYDPTSGSVQLWNLQTPSRFEADGWHVVHPKHI